MTKTKREAAAQANVVDVANAPEGANPKSAAPVEKPSKAGAKTKGPLFVIRDKVSGKVFSNPMPEAKAKEALARVEAKERKEHSTEAQFDFEIAEMRIEKPKKSVDEDDE